DALVVLDHGNGAVLRHHADEALAAARDHAMDERIELQQRVQGGAVGGRHELHRIRRQLYGRQRLGNQAGQRGVGVKAFLAAAEDRGIAAFEAKDGAIDRHVGTRLEDDRDYSDRHADLPDDETVGPANFLELGTDWIREGGDLAHRLG